MVISISDLEEEQTYTAIKLGLLLSKVGHLDLRFLNLKYRDHWYTKSENGELLPFQYKMIVNAKAREGNKDLMKVDFDMICLKPPMLIGGDGLIDIAYGKSYYYSQTKIETNGIISVNGNTEEVTGLGWFDHQWGNYNIGGPRRRILWEWFSIKLDDNTEMMVGEAYWAYNKEKCGNIANGINYFNADSELELLENYRVNQIGYWIDKKIGRNFSAGWQLTEPSKNIDLTIIPDYIDQVMRVFIKPVTFWEGVCSVSGTINDKSVTGRAYVELTHTWNSFFPLNLFRKSCNI